MTAVQKEILYDKWNSCDRNTRIRLACDYLKLLRAGDEKLSWLHYLKNSLEEK